MPPITSTGGANPFCTESDAPGWLLLNPPFLAVPLTFINWNSFSDNLSFFNLVHQNCFFASGSKKLSTASSNWSPSLIKEHNYYLAGYHWRMSIVCIVHWRTIHLNVWRGQLHEQLHVLSIHFQSHGGQWGPRWVLAKAKEVVEEPVWNWLVLIGIYLHFTTKCRTNIDDC